jgi:two-component system chemotaxis family response regulator WspR
MTAKGKKPPKKKDPAGSGRRRTDLSREETGATGHHVLIVDDSDSIRLMVRQALEEIPGIKSIQEAADGLEGLSALSRAYCDLVITDVTMPRLDGFKLVSAIRQNPQLKDIMVIVLSSRDDSVDKIKGLTIGANDYVTKPFEQGELQARITVMLKMRDLQEELQRKNQAMEEANLKLALLANQDGLTGIPNRRYFFERFEVEFRRAQRLKAPLGLLMMDIDHFKSFNDTYGHLAGDEALRAVAGVIMEGIRTYDMVGRYGGEEMIAFLPETDREGSLLVAERLRSAVEACEVLPAGEARDKPVGLTVSIGVACWPEIAVKELNELVDAADNALYRAKTGGRNRCSVTPADDDSKG